MKISTIVSVYNAEKFLYKTVNSLLNQNVDLEIILVEDYSKDNSLQVCLDYAKKYPNIKVLQTDGKGSSAAKNTGLKIATGDIISICDDDDYFEPNAYQTVIDLFEHKDIDLIAAGFFDDCDGTKTYRGYKKDVFLSGNDLIPLIINDHNIESGDTTKFFRRKLLKNSKWEPEITHCDDMAFVLSTLLNNSDCKCMILSKPLYNYVTNPDSITHDYDHMFDDEGNLKYIHGYKLIRKKYKLDKRTNDEIGYIIVQYAADAIAQYNPNDYRRKILRQDIKDNFHCFVDLFFHHGLINNIKRLLYIAFEFIFVKI